VKVSGPRGLRRVVAAAVVLGCCAGPASPTGSAGEPAVATAGEPGATAEARGLDLFTSRLRVLLAHRCAGCHGAGSVEGGLDMSTRESLLSGGDRGPAIVPGAAAESLVYRLAARLEEPHMPEEGDPLTPEEIGWLGAWIDLGAPFDRPLVDVADRGPWTERSVRPEDRDFRSFRPLAAVEPPTPADPHGWCRNPIDRFVLAALESAGLAPSAEPPPHSLLRRLSFDLTGLPATRDEIAAFRASPPTESRAAADAADAYARAVDDLLARPAFGERWAQHWLDVARFAESFGYEQDYDRPHAHHYRDFVIKAFNDDLPYDTFIRWQIAGDEFAPDDLDARKATGFLAAGAFPTQLTEKEFETARATEIDDMLGTVGTAMLGLTIGCARCHDHKFDPLPQADYYRMAATFTTTIRGNVDLPVDPVGDARRLAEWEAAVADAVRARDAWEREELPRRFDDFAASWRPAADTPPPVWRSGRLVSARSRAGVPLAALPDGSLLAGGAAADRDAYTIVLDIPLETVAAVRLDALADPSLPRGGPGRAGNGNFALSNLAVTAGPIPVGDGPAAAAVPVRLTDARADFSQTSPGLDVAHAIDTNPTSAWAIDPRVGVAHVAAFDFEQPVTHPGGVRLTVTLEFMNNTKHAIGRPRISAGAIRGGPVDPVTAEHDPLDADREARGRVSELLATPAADRTAAERAELAALHRRFDPGWQALDEAVRRLEAARPAASVVTVLVAGENVPKIPHHADGRGYPHFYPETHFLRRGDVHQKEGVAAPGGLQVLLRHPDGFAHWQAAPPEGASTSHRRAALARWITDVDAGAGGLAARVIVNRLWQHHVGAGLVATPSDFGRQGEPPTHPELLDWLAGELIRGGWRLKPIHRLIVTSATYRQSSDPDAAKAAIDPGNRLLWRYNRRRLEGEAIRDTMLALAGRLDPALYGRAGRDEGSPRRSIYLERKRSRLPLFLRTFDSPDFVSGVARRSETTTAPQALTIMNSPLVRGWAEAFARRIVAEAGAPPFAAGTNADDTGGRWIRAAYETALGREPTAAEFRDASGFLQGQEAAWAEAGRADPAVAALADFCQVIMGLNETIHIE